MRRLTSYFTIFLLGMNAVACATVKRTFNGEDFRVDKVWWDSRTDAINPKDLDAMQIDLATYCAGAVETWLTQDITYHTTDGQLKTAEVRVPKCDKSGLAYDAAKKSAVARNHLQDLLLRVADDECEKHRGAVVGTNSGTNLLLSTLASLTSGAATGFAAKTTKTALSGVSAFFIASRSHVNEQVYHQIFVGTVLKAIDDDRKSVQTEIASRRRFPVPNDTTYRDVDETQTISGPTTSSTASWRIVPATHKGNLETDAAIQSREGTLPGGVPEKTYSVEQAIKDAGEYHTRCSFYNGLVRVAKTVEQASPCRRVSERREQVLSEMAAIKAAGAAATVYKEKFDAYQSELTTLSAKLTACVQGATTP